MTTPRPSRASSPNTLVTVDCLVEGTHFHREWAPPRLLGRKALSTSLSDVAAMGGTPRHATISLCLPPDTPFAFVDGLYDGLLERAAETSVNLIGGNVAAAGRGIVIDVTLLGQADRLIRAFGGRGRATGSWSRERSGLRPPASCSSRRGFASTTKARSLRPGFWTESSRWSAPPLPPGAPRPAARPSPWAAPWARREIAHAAIDVSDGLSGDLLQLCEASGLAAWIDRRGAAGRPDAAVVARAGGRDVADLALHGGEDYQLLLAVPPHRVAAARELALVWGVALTEIGAVRSGRAREVSLRTGRGREPLAAARSRSLPGREDAVEPAPR